MQPADHPPPVLDIRGLSLEVAAPEGRRAIVDAASFALGRGETLCLAGESGSGKSVTALAVMRLLPPAVRPAAGQILLEGRDLMRLDERAMQDVRGGDVAMIFQEPMTSLNPIMSIGAQLTEAIAVHHGIRGAAARKRALQALDAVRISESARRLRQYPHELSGGMRQRVMIAMALAGNPKVLIADEPTTALDVTIQAQILALMNELKRDFGAAVLLITHDMGVVAEMADRVVVMNAGRIVEQRPVMDLFQAPAEPYTRRLLAAVPRLGSTRGIPAEAAAGGERPLLEVRELTVRFDIKGGILQRPVRRVHAVERVSFDLAAGETLALVGESGCGKSTIGKALVNLVPFAGSIRIAGQEIAGLAGERMKQVRRNIQLVFQDPYAALNPRISVGELVAEPLVIHGVATGAELADRVAGLFRRVGLEPEMMQRHPHEFSGGQRQRICIARALALGPKIIIADEAVSALDVSVQAQVLDLLRELQAELGIAYLFISHDMAVVEQVSHRVAVMYLGRIVEIGPRDRVFEDPRHSYTQRLLDAVPIADPAERRPDRALPMGEVPSPIRPLGYEPEPAELVDVGGGHFAAAAAE